MTPREQLERVLRPLFAGYFGPPLVVEDEELLCHTLDAVDAVRPAPMALSEGWLREVERLAQHRHGVLSAVGMLEDVRRLLGHIRWLEGVLADRCKDTPDWDALRQEGREEERREVVDVLSALAEQYRRQGNLAHEAAALVAVQQIEARGPTRLNALHEIRAEVRALRQALRDILAIPLPVGPGLDDPLRQVQKIACLALEGKTP